MYAAKIGRENVLVAILAGRLIDFCSRALDRRMWVMTIRADRCRRITLARQRGMNAAVPLLDLVGMAAFAGFGRSDGIAARGLDVFFAWRMRGGIDVGVTAGATVGTVDRFCVHVGRHLRTQAIAARQFFLHAGGTVTAETVLVGGRWRFVGGVCWRRGGQEGKRCGGGRDRRAGAQEGARDFWPGA